MKKRSKKIIRRVGVGLGIFIVAVLVLVGGVFFVFGDDTASIFGARFPVFIGGGGEDLGDDYVDSRIVSSGGGEVGVSDGGASGGGGGGGAFVCNDWRPIQYSLANFNENIECLIYGVGTCEKVKASCSSELVNLDYDVGGNFGIRFSYFTGMQEDAFEVIEWEVSPRGRVILRSEVILYGSYDVSSMKCVVDSEIIPEKCFG